MFRVKFRPKKFISVHSSPSKLESPKIFSIGFGAATFGSLSGVGGGVLMVPLLGAFSTLSRHQITASSLFGVMSNGISSTTSFLSMGVPVDYTTSLIIGSFAGVSSNFGARFGKKMDPKRLTRYFAYLAFTIGLFVPLYGLYKKNQTGEKRNLPYKELVFAFAGTACGFLSGLLGVGGAIFYVPLLMSITDLPQVSIIGTAILATLVPAIIGVLTHYRIGNLDVRKSIILGLGCTVGGIIGSRLAKYTKEDYLRFAFGIVVFSIGVRQFRISK